MPGKVWGVLVLTTIPQRRMYISQVRKLGRREVNLTRVSSLTSVSIFSPYMISI